MVSDQVWLSEVPSGRRLSGNGILLGTKVSMDAFVTHWFEWDDQRGT